jgi:hypothetical protein
MNELTVSRKTPEWQRLKPLVLDSVSSPITKRVYSMALDEFFAWYDAEPRAGFTKATVSAWRVSLEERKLGSSSIMAIPEAGPGATEYAGYHNTERPARPRHHRRTARLRPAPVRGGGAYDGARATARRPVGDSGFGVKTQAGPHRADADLGEGGHRRLDGSRRRNGRLRLPTRAPRRRVAGRPAVGKSGVATSATVRGGGWRRRNRAA